MLAQTGAAAEEQAGRPLDAPGHSRVRRIGPASALGFMGGAGLVLSYALPGGAFDTVVRQEYGVVLWAAVAFGLAFGVLPRVRPTGLSVALLGVLVLLAAWTALSLTWTESAERTTAELARVLDYSGLVALLILTVDRGTWRPAAGGLVAGALLVCPLAVLSRLAPSAFPLPALYQPSGTNRLSYPFGYWNAVGAWASMSIAMGLAWSAHERSRVRRALTLGAVPVGGVAAYLTLSRTSAAAAILSVGVVFVLSRRRGTVLLHAAVAAAGTVGAVLVLRGEPEIAKGVGAQGWQAVTGVLLLAVVLAAAVATLTGASRFPQPSIPPRLSRGALAMALVLVVILGAAFGPHLVSRGWREFRQPVPPASSDPTARLTQLSGNRYYVWSSAWEAFTTHPLRGTGAGTFEFWWNRHQVNSEFVRNAHSLELESLAELGLPGGVLTLSVLAVSLWLLIRCRRRSRRARSAGASVAMLGGLVVYVLAASVDWMWQSTAVTALALALAAVAGGRLAGTRPAWPWYWRAPAVGFGLVALAIQIPGILAARELAQSQAAVRGGHGPVALAWANAAVSAEPWAASPYEQRGLILEAGGRLGAAARDLERAVFHERTEFSHWLVLARVEAELGHLTPAERDLRMARRLRPRAFVFLTLP